MCFPFDNFLYAMWWFYSISPCKGSLLEQSVLLHIDESAQKITNVWMAVRWTYEQSKL